jgi:hypothetical protein
MNRGINMYRAWNMNAHQASLNEVKNKYCTVFSGTVLHSGSFRIFGENIYLGFSQKSILSKEHMFCS